MFLRPVQWTLRSTLTAVARSNGHRSSSSQHNDPVCGGPTIVVADEGRTLVCWHPDKGFPYEHSLPIPEKPIVTPSILKARDDVDTFQGLKKDEMVRAQLMKLTYTTKHKWFPRLQKKKAKKTAPDRPYL